MSQLEKYGVAVAKWIARGRPKRTDDDVAGLLAVCQACEHYQPHDEKSGECGLCKCRLSLGGSAMNNKLRMATEICPDGRW